MIRRDNVLVHHRQAIKEAATRRHAASIALVGSVARGDDTEESDYDFYVEFDEDAGLLDWAGLRVDLRKLLGAEVDVIDADALQVRHRPLMEDAILL